MAADGSPVSDNEEYARFLRMLTMHDDGKAIVVNLEASLRLNFIDPDSCLRFLNDCVTMQPYAASKNALDALKAFQSNAKSSDFQFLRAPPPDIQSRVALALRAALLFDERIGFQTDNGREHLRNSGLHFERAALRLAFFVHCRLKEAPDPRDPDLARELVLIDRDLSEARVLQEKLRTSSIDDSQQILRTIAIQIAHNSLEHALYHRLEAAQPIPQLADLEHFLAVLREQPQPDNAGEQWLESLVEAVARYLIHQDGEAALEQRTATATLIERILDRDNPLPQIDRELAMYFRDRLEL